jgi:hypothetical protein
METQNKPAKGKKIKRTIFAFLSGLIIGAVV